MREKVVSEVCVLYILYAASLHMCKSIHGAQKEVRRRVAFMMNLCF